MKHSPISLGAMKARIVDIECIESRWLEKCTICGETRERIIRSWRNVGKEIDPWIDECKGANDRNAVKTDG